MGFSDFQLRRLDMFYTQICQWKLKASLAERGTVEERMSGRSPSLGVIRIMDGQIRWVNIQTDIATDWTAGEFSVKKYKYIDYTEYGIPDPRLTPESAGGGLPFLHIKLDRVKSFPLVGRPVSIRWKGEDVGLDIISRLNSDILLNNQLIDSPKTEITADDYHHCWILSIKTGDVPSKELWDSYQAIAQNLLTEWFK